MKANDILMILLAIIVVIAVLYLIAFLLKRRNDEKLDELEKRKSDLFDLPVIEEVDEVKQMHLVGQSQNTFREWNKQWQSISTSSFAELESQIFEVENLNETFRFLKVRHAIGDAFGTMEKMETEVAEVRQGLKELRESEERNSLAVQKALDAYEEMNARVKKEKDSFGPAQKELLKQVKTIETLFTQFVSLNTAGDPMEARSVLDEAEEKTYQIQTLVDQVPNLYEKVSKEFPEQLNEIEEGHKKLVESKYKFPKDDLLERVKKLRAKVEATSADLEKCEVASVEAVIPDIENEIDDLYDVMEKEIEARQYVKDHHDLVLDYVKHATRNNRQLMIELDHISQSYALNHNELGQARGFQVQIEEVDRQLNEFSEKQKNDEVIYSELSKFYHDSLQILDDIETQQVAIDESLQDLRDGEKDAQRKLDEYEFKLRNLKRFIEKQRLPGIPNEYLEFFFVTTDRIEELAKELGKIRIDMEKINQLVRSCSDDLTLLEQKSNEVVDSAALTEQMLQYANRFRHSHPTIHQAIDRSLVLFNQEYRYQDALDEIGSALEQTEPGAFKRIESYYYANH